MDKKFVNLPSNYKNFLNEYIKKLSKKDIIDIASKKIDYKNICSIHNKINKVLKDNNCTSYDINKMIHSYDKSNKEKEIISLLRKIASLRNRYIVSNGSKTKYWSKNISDLKSRYSKINSKKKLTNSDVEKSFVDLLTKYKYDWDGLWSIFELDKNNDITNINVFDLEDFDFIVKNLNKSKK